MASHYDKGPKNDYFARSQNVELHKLSSTSIVESLKELEINQEWPLNYEQAMILY